MKRTFYAIAMTTLAAMPASAGTSFPFTCTSEADHHLTLSLFAEGGGYAQAYDHEPYEIIWQEIGNVTIIARYGDPSSVPVSFVSETGEALMPHAQDDFVRGTCRLGAE